MQVLQIWVAIVLLALMACTSEVKESTPKQTVLSFTKAMSDLDFEQAQQYCSEDAKKTLLLIETNLKMSEATTKDQLKSIFQLPEDSVVCEEQMGTMTCIFYDGESGEAVAEFQMVEQDKRWLVKQDFQPILDDLM